MLPNIILKSEHYSYSDYRGIEAKTPVSETVGPGSNPLDVLLVFFCSFPNFKGKFPLLANFCEHGTLSMLIYMLQRVAKAKSHSRAITYSVCQFSKEKCNY